MANLPCKYTTAPQAAPLEWYMECRNHGTIDNQGHCTYVGNVPPGQKCDICYGACGNVATAYTHRQALDFVLGARLQNPDYLGGCLDNGGGKYVAICYNTLTQCYYAIQSVVRVRQ